MSIINPKHLADNDKVMYNAPIMSFAVIQTGGKQYKVAVGDTIKVEKILGDHKVGDTITLDTVILKDNGTTTELGAPFIKGSSVSATVTEEGKLDKVMVVRYRAKSRYHKRNGHKQPFTGLKIEAIK